MVTIYVEEGVLDLDISSIKDVSRLHKVMKDSYQFVRAWMSNAPEDIGLDDVVHAACTIRKGEIYEKWDGNSVVVLRIVVSNRPRRVHFDGEDDSSGIIGRAMRVRI